MLRRACSKLPLYYVLVTRIIPTRLPNIDRAAEHAFAKLCSLAGAHAQKVSEDVSGWDYLVEFPPIETSPADAQKPGLSVYVQVKSTSGEKAETFVTLSNARRMAQPPSPWFIVLFHRTKTGRLRIYGAHWWQEWIHRSLKAVREAEANRRKLNKSRLTITFNRRDEHGSKKLLEWIEKTVATIGDDYSALKKDIYSNVGHEDGYGTATFTVEAKSEEEIARGFVGLGNGLQVSEFTLTPKRFGIAGGQVRHGSGTIRIEPSNWTNGSIRFRSTSESATFPCKCAVTSLPKRVARISGGWFDLIFSFGKAHHFEFGVRYNENDPRPLSEIENQLRVVSWWHRSDLRAEIWLNGAKSIVRLPAPHEKFAVDRLRPTVSYLRSLVQFDVPIRLADLLKKARQLRWFYVVGASDETDCIISFTDLDGVPFGAKVAIYYATLSLADHYFFVLVRREIVREEHEGAGRLYVLGKPQIIDSYVTPLSSGSERFQEEYEQQIRTIGLPAIGIGDVEIASEGPADIPVHTSPELDALADEGNLSSRANVDSAATM